MNLGVVVKEVKAWSYTALGGSANIAAVYRGSTATNLKDFNQRAIDNEKNGDKRASIFVEADAPTDANMGHLALMVVPIEIRIVRAVSGITSDDPMDGIDDFFETLVTSLNVTNDGSLSGSGTCDFNSFSWDGKAPMVDTYDENPMQAKPQSLLTKIVGGVIRFNAMVPF